MRRGLAVQVLTVALIAALTGAVGYSAGSSLLTPHADLLILIAGLSVATAMVGRLSDIDLAASLRHRSVHSGPVGTKSLVTKIVIIGPLLLAAWGAYWLPTSLATDDLLEVGEFLAIASIANLIWDTVDWRRHRAGADEGD